MNHRFQSFDTPAIAYSIAGLLFAAAYFAFPAAESTLRFSRYGMLTFPVCYVFLIGAAAAGLGVAARGRSERMKKTAVVLNALALILAVLAVSAVPRRIDVPGLFFQSLRLSTPIALGACAGILCEKSGVINIAIEGMMLTAACIGFTAAVLSQSILAGLFAAMFGGALMAALHAVLSVGYRVDQIVSGTAVNILAVGLTGFIRRGVLLETDLPAPAVFPFIRIPFLADIPVVGRIFFRHQPMVYTMLGIVFLLRFLLAKTRWGLRTRAAGEHPRAVDTVGVNVFAIRYANVIAGGMVAGLAGAWFSLETVGDFDNLMTGGKGFIALAAMIFGKWRPPGALGGALLFGFADALQIKLQIGGVNLPYQLLGMTPYLVTMVVLAGVVGRAAAPAAVGIPYKRE